MEATEAKVLDDIASRPPPAFRSSEMVLCTSRGKGARPAARSPARVMLTFFKVVRSELFTHHAACASQDNICPTSRSFVTSYAGSSTTLSSNRNRVSPEGSSAAVHPQGLHQFEHPFKRSTLYQLIALSSTGQRHRRYCNRRNRSCTRLFTPRGH